MEGITVLAALRASLAAGVSDALGMPAADSDFRVPGRGAAAASALLVRRPSAAADAATRLFAAADRFPPVCGVLPVANVSFENGWLLFALTPAFYTAALREVLSALPPPAPDGGHLYNRLSLLARRPSDTCPDVPSVQRALLLSLAAHETPTPAARGRAADALLSMAHPLPPKERQALLDQTGGVAMAALRLLF